MLVRKDRTHLTRTGEWDTLGMRGTRSLGFTLDAFAAAEQIVPVPFADIASQTMLPVSHVLWTSLWLGLATDAVARARAFVRAEARRDARRRCRRAHSGSPRRWPSWTPCVPRSTAGCADFERHQDDPETLAGLGFAIRMNNLKASASRMAPDIVVARAGGVRDQRLPERLAVRGWTAPARRARRRAMISNDRILSANAAMLLVHKDD